MAFASVEDVATRLARTLSSDEASRAEMLLDAATAVIAEAAGKTDAWSEALDPVPQMLRFLAVELVVRVIGNPDSVRSLSEQLGAHQYSMSFRDAAAGGGLLLTDVEVLLVRRVVHGTTSGSVKVHASMEDVYDQYIWPLDDLDDECGS